MADQELDAPALGSVRLAERPSTRAGEEPAAVSAAPDRATLRLALVVGGLVLSVLLGFGLGRINGGGTATAGGADSALADHVHAPGVGAHSHGADQAAAAEAGGLAVSRDGLTLTPRSAGFIAGQAGELRFQIRDGQRRTVTRFAVVHDKPMHLIVVRRDLTGYQHLHPTMAADGTWSVPLTLPQPGVWRAYADFTALADDGRQTATTLGVDLVAPGDYTPRALPEPATRTTVDGFTVGFQGGPQPGLTVPVSFRITGPDGTGPVLERYLGAYGHLVALREGDLGYLHVHPEAELVDGAIRFWLTTPGPGRYRLYLDFAVAGEVRTAEFTVLVS
ncbi:hypothetical protein SAMN05443287_103536 [Micromonospora phaseoli]|uniref:Heavy-metal-associated domain-containing protein n=1 Tax=Micromonospora phaseoli TaxID=1144548 RepID=A0A1H6XEB8_9ACTN|nr:hypothetical protein [Micromonospora phaseoli]PZW02160.1 hypothetical protein CLV64_102534 [Micromonospora phaseoli]GIJ75839.1 hypothetical protein Xph01_02710 [Micromonospora phaseoli]SEJ25844.1 hypothetical protein SAMN05443287_103536 [Micromonospora phaseoli]